MTDAALGNSNTDRPKPIKNEHSYSLLNCSSSDSLPDDGDNDSEEVPKCTENDSRQSKTHIDHDRVGTNDYSSQDAVNVFSSDNSRIDGKANLVLEKWSFFCSNLRNFQQLILLIYFRWSQI